MRGVDDAIEERLMELNDDQDAQRKRFAAWMSAHIAEMEAVEVEPSAWEISSAENGSLFPAFRVKRFSVETEHGWTELEALAEEEEPVVEEQGLGWLIENDEEPPVDLGPGFTYAADARPTWVIYAWQAYSGNKYAVESRDTFLDACVCARELGPYR